MSKKGMEMSVNIVVGMVLGIAMFIAGILIFRNIMDNAQKSQDEVDEMMKEKINDALDSGEPVYVPESNIDVNKKSASFWFGLRNIENEAGEFTVSISPVSPVPANFEQSNIAFIDGPYSVAAKEKEVIKVAVDMSGIAEKVTLKLTVEKEDEDGNLVQYAKPKIITINP